jgi:hypothetical protein
MFLVKPRSPHLSAVAALVLVAIATVPFERSLGRSESIPLDQASAVQGQLVLLSRDVIVVLAPGETNIIIPLYPGAHVDHALKEGEHVMVSISSDRAVAVRRIAPSPPTDWRAASVRSQDRPEEALRPEPCWPVDTARVLPAYVQSAV